MIKVEGILPRKLAVACSGGVDSIAIADFLSRKHQVELIHINHNEGNSDQAEQLVREFASVKKLPLTVVSKIETRPSNMSWEEHWRNQRYEVFHKYQEIVITGHHLDDCVETYIWSALNGMPKVIPYVNKNVWRPFRQNLKEVFIDWAKNNNLEYIEDESNKNMRFVRNIIRNELLPVALKVNPGLAKVVLRRVINTDSISEESPLT